MLNKNQKGLKYKLKLILNQNQMVIKSGRKVTSKKKGDVKSKSEGK